MSHAIVKGHLVDQVMDRVPQTMMLILHGTAWQLEASLAWLPKQCSLCNDKMFVYYIQDHPH